MPSSQPRPTGSRPPTGPPSGPGARSGSGPRPRARSGARVAATRTFDLTEGKPPTKSRPKSSAGKSGSKPAARSQGQATFNPSDPGVQRRAAKKAQRRQKNFLVWTIFAGLTTCIGAAAFGAWTSPISGHKFRGVWHEYQDVKGKVAHKQNLLRALQTQLNNNQKRLSEFAHNTGHERALVENGFIQDGDRLLLFPKDDANKNGNSQAGDTAADGNASNTVASNAVAPATHKPNN